MSRSREICKCIKMRLDHVMSLRRSSVIRHYNKNDAKQKLYVFASTQARTTHIHIAHMCLHLTCTLGRSI